MANITLNSKIQLRNDLAANWLSTNPVLLKGELGIEIDTLTPEQEEYLNSWKI